MADGQRRPRVWVARPQEADVKSNERRGARLHGEAEARTVRQIVKPPTENVQSEQDEQHAY